MSGGSYDYLYGASDLEELLGRRNSLREMAERLNGMVVSGWSQVRNLKYVNYALWSMVANAVFEAMSNEEWKAYLRRRETECVLPK